MEVESYKTHVIYNLVTRKYFGELWVNNKREQRTTDFQSEAVAITRLNRRIESFNAMNGTKIPPYQKDANTNQFKAELLESAEEHQPISPTQKAEAEKEKPLEKVKPKATKPRRKPFTPYGLNGYFVDKEGNIRLHLDRKAHAHTIVLNPDIFSMLANMVQATQEQNNETFR